MGNKKCVISSEVTGQIVRNLVRNLVRSDGIKSLTIVQVFVHIVVHVSSTHFVFESRRMFVALSRSTCRSRNRQKIVDHRSSFRSHFRSSFTRFVFRICLETDVRCFVYLSFTSSSTRPRFVEFSIFVQIIFVFFVQISVHVLFCSQISSLSAQPSYLFVSTGRLQLEH